MFTKFKSIIVTALISTMALTAIAQTTNTPTTTQSPPAPSFFGDAESFFTSFGSNTWNTSHGYVETGAAYQNNVDIASTFELGYNVWSPSTNSNYGLTLGSETLNAGIAGAILSEQLDVAWRLDIKDVQILAGVGGGYDFQKKEMFPAVFGELQKKLGANTHAFIRLETELTGKSTSPVVAAGVGFSF